MKCFRNLTGTSDLIKSLDITITDNLPTVNVLIRPFSNIAGVDQIQQASTFSTLSSVFFTKSLCSYMSRLMLLTSSGIQTSVSFALSAMRCAAAPKGIATVFPRRSATDVIADFVERTMKHDYTLDVQ